jgi:hypothetical protein
LANWLTLVGNSSRGEAKPARNDEVGQPENKHTAQVLCCGGS